MRRCPSWLLGIALLALLPAAVSVQQAGYPIEVVPPGKGPFSFPAGYQTPWDRIQIFVTAKTSSPRLSIQFENGSGLVLATARVLVFVR